MKIIRVEIEVDDCVRCPDSAEDLSDLLYGIGDGQIDGRVTITDSPIVSDVPISLGDGVAWVVNIDRLGPVLPLDSLARILRRMQNKDLAHDAMDQTIALVEEITRRAREKPAARLPDEFYPEAI